MAKLHNEPIRVGDMVFDVSATRGHGKVINITKRGLEVQYGTAGARIMYREDGVQLGRSRPTLFWRDPIIVYPVRDETLWEHQKRVAIEIREILLGVKR